MLFFLIESRLEEGLLKDFKILLFFFKFKVELSCYFVSVLLDVFSVLFRGFLVSVLGLGV